VAIAANVATSRPTVHRYGHAPRPRYHSRPARSTTNAAAACTAVTPTNVRTAGADGPPVPADAMNKAISGSAATIEYSVPRV
jgi:hypothetical protein